MNVRKFNDYVLEFLSSQSQTVQGGLIFEKILTAYTANNLSRALYYPDDNWKSAAMDGIVYTICPRRFYFRARLLRLDLPDQHRDERHYADEKETAYRKFPDSAMADKVMDTHSCLGVVCCRVCFYNGVWEKTACSACSFCYRCSAHLLFS